MPNLAAVKTAFIYGGLAIDEKGRCRRKLCSPKKPRPAAASDPRSLFCLAFGAALFSRMLYEFARSFSPILLRLSRTHRFFSGCLGDRSAHNSSSNIPDAFRKVFTKKPKKKKMLIAEATMAQNFAELNQPDSCVCVHIFCVPFGFSSFIIQRCV